MFFAVWRWPTPTDADRRLDVNRGRQAGDSIDSSSAAFVARLSLPANKTRASRRVESARGRRRRRREREKLPAGPLMIIVISIARAAFLVVRRHETRRARHRIVGVVDVAHVIVQEMCANRRRIMRNNNKMSRSVSGELHVMPALNTMITWRTLINYRSNGKKGAYIRRKTYTPTKLKKRPQSFVVQEFFSIQSYETRTNGSLNSRLAQLVRLLFDPTCK